MLPRAGRAMGHTLSDTLAERPFPGTDKALSLWSVLPEAAMPTRLSGRGSVKDHEPSTRTAMLSSEMTWNMGWRSLRVCGPERFRRWCAGRATTPWTRIARRERIGPPQARFSTTWIDAIEDGVSASSGPTARANGGSGRLAAAY